MASLPVETIALLQKHSLPAMVRHELERRILAGELLPGAKLNEADIADDLKVSRGPVREAFRALDQAGLVRTEKNRGVFVRELTHFEADEIYEVRAGLDAMIGQLVAERCTPAQVEALKKLLKEMDRAAKKRSVDEYYPLNVRFHDLLAQFTGNETLLAMYRRLVNELHLYRRETLEHGPESFPTSTKEHQAIVDAISRGDAEAASRLLHDHAIESRERLHRTLERASIPLPRPAAKKRRKSA
ncbi:phosphonate utilization associated transcriptional regulator [Usitatibacter palustris]|uniref:HTH-type transcriptional repressor RspR n=1 Tax=Usitatibacter palustris TaxID=2732487 RepID=A0A6M4H4I8_9PROT|nr:phosphonate utilization associated transcriptional regulator [Usitatibacter palustris]QJR14370.1 HTH-type transcriptional repressor RspR [Usitatibacter palustris]